jgi:20S proteasome alpha/beta subunit
VLFGSTAKKCAIDGVSPLLFGQVYYYHREGSDGPKAGVLGQFPFPQGGTSMLMLKPLPLPDSKPRIKRLPRSKKVTIAAGFVCYDGMILCADTQEVIPGYTKNETEKIREWKDRGLCIAIAGAGDTELIEALSQRIESKLTGGYSPREVRFTGECREIIEKTLIEFFNTAVRPWATFPRDDRPAMPDLLILLGVSNEVNQYDCLFKTSGTSVRELNPAGECIGTGIMTAKGLIERFYCPFDSLEDSVLIASYILYHAKRWTDGCGGNTHVIVSSAKSDFFGCPFSPAEIKTLENMFEEFDDLTKPLLIGFANPNMRPTTFKSQAKDIQERLSEVKRQHSKSLAGILESLARLKSKPSLASEQPPEAPAQS